MIVVSDTSCITNLISLGKVSLLHEIFGIVIVPDAVARELRVIHADLPSFLTIRSVSDPLLVSRFAGEMLDTGEAEAIVLAEELSADVLLIDEAAGRAVALRRQIPIIGLLGVLVRAKEERLIPAVAPLLDQLRDEIGFYFSEALRQRTLKAAGES